MSSGALTLRSLALSSLSTLALLPVVPVVSTLARERLATLERERMLLGVEVKDHGYCTLQYYLWLLGVRYVLGSMRSGKAHLT
jgi:hypothetical protein